MKKYLTTAFAVIALFSCNKKETTTVSEAQSDSLQTSVGTAPDSTTPNTIKLAIEDSAGIYTQRLFLQKGQTYPLVTYQRNVQSMTGPDGKKATATSNSTDEMSFLVNSVENGVYAITINLLGKSSSQTANGKTVRIDTRTSAPKEPELKMMYEINKALAGKKLQMQMDQTGKVLSIKGFEPIYNEINKLATTHIKDAEQRKGFIQSFQANFNEKTINEQFSKNLIVLPKTGAKIGQKWSETENASQDGSSKFTTHYTLDEVKDGKVKITVRGGIPRKSDKRTQEGITQTITSELSQTGSIFLDQKSGWIKNQNITVKTDQTETLSDGKQSQSLKSSNTATIIVNPEK